jgi:hypothetical protein
MATAGTKSVQLRRDLGVIAKMIFTKRLHSLFDFNPPLDERCGKFGTRFGRSKDVRFG